MASNYAEYGTAQTIAMTLASLASGAARESDEFNNATTKWIDGELVMSFGVGAGTLGDLFRVNVYVVPSMDNSNWPSPATGANAAITISSGGPVVGHLVGYIPIIGVSATVKAHFRTLLAYDSALTLSKYFSFVVENRCGVAFSASASTTTFYGKRITST